MFQFHVGGEVPGRDERSLVADVGDVGSREPWGSGGHLTGQLLPVLPRLYGLQVNLEDGRSKNR